MKRKYLVVSEGETDFEVLRAIIEEHANNAQWKVKVDPVFPGIGHHKKNGGWSNLKNWCIEQAKDLSGPRNLAAAAAALGAPKTVTPTPQSVQKRKDKIAAALLLQPPYSFATFVFQLDTDVAESYMGDTSLANLATPLSVSDRRLVGEAALDNWLGAHIQKKNNGIIYCISTHATETFLLANHDAVEISSALKTSAIPNDYDHLKNPDLVLVELGYSSETDKGNKVLKKTTAKYKKHSEKFANNLINARLRSSSLDTFVNML